MTKHLVLYLPGIGDHKPRLQKSLLRIWKLFGLDVDYQTINWIDKEPFELKLHRIVRRIDELVADNKTISLVGVSAGASAAINAYLLRPGEIDRVVFVCGKLNNPQSVGARYYVLNPAFKDSMDMLGANITKLTTDDKTKMLSMHPIYDQTVPVGDTKIKGVKEKLILAVWHVPSIFVGLTFYARLIARFIKSK